MSDSDEEEGETASGRSLAVDFPRADDARSLPIRVCFGDRIGLALFLGSLCLFAIYWITDWRINDSLTLLNALHGMSEGHLNLGTAKYGNGPIAPGAVTDGEHVYGRNYGILALSLVPLAVVEVLAAVTELRIAFAGLWSLGILALALVLGSILDRRRDAARWGSVVALALFALNVALATPLDPTATELYALQLTHLVAAGFVVVLTYRLLARVHDRRLGLAGAALVALGTPVGLWATFPKRHVFTAAVVLAVGYALYRSRSATLADPLEPVTYRASAYALVGLFAWVHAPEALMLVVVLAVVDVPTAPENDRRTLAIVGGVTLLSLVPFVVTNYLVSGSPVKPPRMLPWAGNGAAEASPVDDMSGSSGGESSSGTEGGSVFDPLLSALLPVTTLVDLVGGGLRNLLRQPGEVSTVFLRSGYVESVASYDDHEAINLSVLESAPVVAAALGVVPAARRRLDRRIPSSLWPLSPERVLDVFLLLFAVVLSLAYLSKLPIHAQITVRYLVPVYPILAYFVVRTPAIRALAREHWRTFGWSFAAGVLVGGQLAVVAVVSKDLGVGESFQLHGVLGLSIGVVVGSWALAGRTDGWWGRAGAIVLGLAAAATTVFLLLATLVYFSFGSQQLLPIVRAFGRTLSLA